LAQPLPGTPPAPAGQNEVGYRSSIDNMPPSYVYAHAPLPNVQFVNHNTYAKDCKYDKDFNPDLLTDDEISTG